MQEILVYILVLVAAIIVGIKAWKAIREITNPNPCGGCGKSCEGCPVAPRKERRKDGYDGENVHLG